MKKKVEAIVLSIALVIGILAGAAVPAVNSRAADDTVSVSYDVKYGQLEARLLVRLVNKSIKLAKEKITLPGFLTVNELEQDYGLESAAITRAGEIAIYNSATRPNGSNYDTAFSNKSDLGECYEIRLGDLDLGKILENEDPAALLEVLNFEDISKLLLDGYKYIGIGHVTAADVHYWVIEFSQKPSGTGSTAGSNSKVTLTTSIKKDYIKSRSLKLGEATTTMYIGDEAKLPEVTGNMVTDDGFHTDNLPAVVNCGTPVWTSSDPSIVSISGSNARANKKGEASITAASTFAGGEGRGSYTVNVAGEKIHPASVTLDKTSLIMHPGDTITIQATVLPANSTDGSLKWASSNPVVASVAQVISDTKTDTSPSNIKKADIVAISEGTTEISATTTDGEKKAVCQVSVSKDGVIHVDSVKLSNESITLYEGGSGMQLSATVYPDNAADKKLIWTVKDKSVAQVTPDGFVTPVNRGTTHVTVTAADNEKSADCIVTVLKGERIPATFIKLNATSTKLLTGQTLDLAATVSPAESTDILTWSSTMPSIAALKVSDDRKSAVVTAGESGEATIFVKTPDGLTASCSIVVRTPEEQAVIDGQKEAVKSAKTKVKKLDDSGKKIKVTLAKKKISGVSVKYQIRYRVSGGKWKSVTSSKPSKVITGIKPGKKYIFKARIFATVDGDKCYGPWSQTKKTGKR